MERSYFELYQLTDSLPKLWNDHILNCKENLMDLCIFDHHLIKKNNIQLEQVTGVENYIKYKFLKSTKHQLRGWL